MMTDEKLKQQLIDELLILTKTVEIPPGAITVRDLIKKGMVEYRARRILRELYAQGTLERARGENYAYFYWPKEKEE